jgi:hypothetical protein
MTVTSTGRDAKADPLYALPLPERPVYATGMMLGADDFAAEQTYHRGRLANALARLAGGGTLAGLRAAWRDEVSSGPDAHPEEIRVDPGVAVDRLGRLIELPRPACLRLRPWFEQQSLRNGGDDMRQASYDDLARFASPRLASGGPAWPAAAVIADIYLRFVACAQGYTPSFATGPYDALDAVSTSRLRDAYELVPAMRSGLSGANRGLPLLPADLGGSGGLGDAARRNAVQDEVLDGYPVAGRAGSTDPLGPLTEHPRDFVDFAAVFVARVFIPIQELVATGAPRRDTAVDPIVDNFGRRFVPAIGVLARALGI